MIAEKIAETEKAQQYISSCVISILAISKRATSEMSTKQAAIDNFNKIIETVNTAETYYQKAFGNYHFEETKRIKKGFRIIRNHAQSIVGLYETEEIDRQDLVEFSEKQQNRCLKLNALILSVSKKVLEKRGRADSEGSDYSDSTALPETGGEEKNVKVLATKSVNDILSEIGPELLRDLQKYSSKMPSAMDRKKPFVISRLPIIPRFSNILSEKELQDAGFKTKMLAKYPVLLDQLVVGENVNVLAQPTVQKIKDPTNPRKKVDIVVKDKPYMPNVQEVIDAIQQKTKKRVVVMNKVRPKEHGFNWYWLVPESQIVALNRKNKHFNVLDWDFAFRT